MKEHIKVFTGTAILVNRLAQLLDEQKIPSIIKDTEESGRLAGFGTTGDSAELHIFDIDIERAKPIVTEFEKEISE